MVESSSIAELVILCRRYYANLELGKTHQEKTLRRWLCGALATKLLNWGTPPACLTEFPKTNYVLIIAACHILATTSLPAQIKCLVTGQYHTKYFSAWQHGYEATNLRQLSRANKSCN